MPEQKQCKQCQKEFEVKDEDLAFLAKTSPTFAGKKFEIPAPTLCPHCRWQRRIVWRNEYALYKRKCDKTGQEIISNHHSTSPFPVYHASEWKSDSWNAKDYAQEFDPTRPFFAQMSELINKVPRQHLFVDMDNLNSDFTNCNGQSKNCYMLFEGDRNEECYYSRGITDSKDCVDCLRIDQCQICYQGIDINSCYNCFYLSESENCSECYFSSNLIGCKNCFGCDNLNQKQYYIYNEPVGQEKWDEFMKGVRFNSSSTQEYLKKMEEIRLKNPKRFAKVIKCENSTGDHLTNCKNTHYSFDSLKQQDCAYCFEVANEAKDAYDLSTFGVDTNLVYECNSCGYGAYNLIFCNDTWSNASDCLYCDNVQSSKNCFGCVGIRKGEYCILNKQYTKEEYEKKVAEIITKMKESGEWGEFFPMSISVFGYNETIANDYFPLDKERAMQIGAKWQDDDRMIHFDGPFYEPKEEIKEYENNEKERQALLLGILKCEKTGKPFKITPQELAFYIKHSISVPRVSFEARHKARIAKRNPFMLWERQCDCDNSSHGHGERCENIFETTYSPETPYKIYCELCYQKSII